MAHTRIREVFERIDKRNPISGHQWTEYGPTTGYEIVGPTGVCATARTEKSALQKQHDWEAFYQKYPPMQ